MKLNFVTLNHDRIFDYLKLMGLECTVTTGGFRASYAGDLEVMSTKSNRMLVLNNKIPNIAFMSPQMYITTIEKVENHVGYPLFG